MTRPAALDEYPKTVVLKDGAHLVLRVAEPTDAAGLQALASRLGSAERARLGADGLRVVALDGTAVAGMGVLAPAARAAERRVDVLLDPAYRERRLGTWMLLDLVHLAMALEIERLVAVVPADDPGFGAALRRLDFASDPGDARTVVKLLHAGWTDF